MYHHNINIAVFGENSFLKNIVETIPSMDYLDCTVICLENFDPALAAQSDIIIFNGRANFHEARGCASQMHIWWHAWKPGRRNVFPLRIATRWMTFGKCLFQSL